MFKQLTHADLREPFGDNLKPPTSYLIPPTVKTSYLIPPTSYFRYGKAGGAPSFFVRGVWHNGKREART